jgi:hypothetical protein
MSMLPQEKTHRFPVVVNGTTVLNWEYNSVVDIGSLKNIQTTLIYSKSGSL